LWVAIKNCRSNIFSTAIVNKLHFGTNNYFFYPAQYCFGTGWHRSKHYKEGNDGHHCFVFAHNEADDEHHCRDDDRNEADDTHHCRDVAHNEVDEGRHCRDVAHNEGDNYL
jgi:hypothetical protein